MAYKKRTSSKSYSRSSRSTGRKRVTARVSRKSSGGSRRTVNTLRIVVEQPQAVSSVVPSATKAARKATF